MATINQLTRLFQAISTRSWSHAREIANCIAEEEEEKGHHTAAQALRGSLSSNGHNGFLGHAELHGDANIAKVLTQGLTPLNLDVGLEDVKLRSRWRGELQSLTMEWKNRQRLAKRGIGHRSKVFFYGPPGCGKSLAARAVAKELRLPAYVVRFDSIIGAYLGQTAMHLRELFRFAESTPSILLLDEVDALGKMRGNPLDVGELDRIVISLMQELEHCSVEGLVIATSNLPSHIDRALWRRFDLLVEFPKPSTPELLSYSREISSAADVTLSRQLRTKISSAKSYAEAERLIQDQARRDVLKGI